MKTYLKLSLFLLSMTQMAQLRSEVSEDAFRLVNQLGKENCSFTENGTHCFKKISSRLVAIIFPNNYISSGRCLVHFHGLRFRSEDRDERKTIEYFRFEEALFKSDSSLLMIAPIGTFGRSNYSLASDFGTLSKLKKLLSNVEQNSGESCLDVSLSGHSAAYRVITPLLNEINLKPTDEFAKNMNETYLFDALYSSNVSPFSKWLTHSNSRYLYNVSLRGGGTDINSKKIPTQSRYVNLISEVPDHWRLLRDRYFQEFLAAH